MRPHCKAFFFFRQPAVSTDGGRRRRVKQSPVADNSVLAEKGTGLWSYNASKAAASHLAKSLSVTLAPRFITVNSINPGVYPTNMTRRGFEKEPDNILKTQPMGRTGTPEDVISLSSFRSSSSDSGGGGADNFSVTC